MEIKIFLIFVFGLIALALYLSGVWPPKEEPIELTPEQQEYWEIFPPDEPITMEEWQQTREDNSDRVEMDYIG